jgi:hypothetical protein
VPRFPIARIRFTEASCALAALVLAAAPLGGIAQPRLSQSGLEEDCLQRLKPLVPRDVKASGASFSALGN